MSYFNKKVNTFGGCFFFAWGPKWSIFAFYFHLLQEIECRFENVSGYPKPFTKARIDLFSWRGHPASCVSACFVFWRRSTVFAGYKGKTKKRLGFTNRPHDHRLIHWVWVSDLAPQARKGITIISSGFPIFLGMKGRQIPTLGGRGGGDWPSSLGGSHYSDLFRPRSPPLLNCPHSV